MRFHISQIMSVRSIRRTVLYYMPGSDEDVPPAPKRRRRGKRVSFKTVLATTMASSDTAAPLVLPPAVVPKKVDQI